MIGHWLIDNREVCAQPDCTNLNSICKQVGRRVFPQKGLLGIREVKRKFLGIKRSHAFGWIKTSFFKLFGAPPCCIGVFQPDKGQPTPTGGCLHPHRVFCKPVLGSVSNVQIQWR